MIARRDFLKGAAASGIFFCGCALLRAAQAQSSTARALPVTVNGKRVKTIDVHSHCHFHEAVNLMGEEAKLVLPQTKGAQEHFIVIEERLKGMDAQAIDMEVLSINPFWYRKERIQRPRSSRCRTRSSPNYAPLARIASPPSPRWPCSIRISQSSSSSTR
jgi:hypothetical protein